MDGRQGPYAATEPGRTAVVGADGPLDILQARQLGAAARDLAAGGAGALVLDLTRTPSADPLGVLTLADEVAALARSGLAVALCGMRPDLEQQLHRAGVSRKAAVCDTVTDACRLLAVPAPASPSPGAPPSRP
ncbi:STAS domain-containing protein [Kitasatospora sp. DSM 101779]|uniref:STAS domain-containing protein n=1 Tax=Kitasatospora sp. DSM 101779 TaxID=2853165 RepID=UPI0021D9AE42|nr:STAS domain-containing protein [Kitasatospora sp. DSM 101779]MCU7826945.1 STAS domain-containing protein [Kitasatospora sp. DSM 101779]